jgi:hypothetical protein
MRSLPFGQKAVLTLGLVFLLALLIYPPCKCASSSRIETEPFDRPTVSSCGHCLMTQIGQRRDSEFNLTAVGRMEIRQSLQIDYERLFLYVAVIVVTTGIGAILAKGR